MRLEYKYLVANSLLPRLRALVAPFVEPDQYMRARPDGYTVRSIYFDTLGLKSYYDKTAGLKERKKVRVRGYNERDEGEIVFLEVKRKDDMFITKSRAPIPYKQLQELLLSGDLERFIETSNAFPRALEDARCFFFHLWNAHRWPTMLVIYEREAYESKCNYSLRLTIDKHIRSVAHPKLNSLFSEEGVVYSLPRYSVLEIKLYGGSIGFPSWLRRVVGALDLRKMSISKYVICSDAHRMPRSRSPSARLAFAHQGDGVGMRRTALGVGFKEGLL